MRLVLSQSTDFLQGTLDLHQISWDQSLTLCSWLQSQLVQHRIHSCGFRSVATMKHQRWQLIVCLKNLNGPPKHLWPHTLLALLLDAAWPLYKQTSALPHYPLLLPHLEGDCLKCPLSQYLHGGPPGLKTDKRKAAVESSVLLSEARSLCTDVTLLLVCALSKSVICHERGPYPYMAGWRRNDLKLCF